MMLMGWTLTGLIMIEEIRKIDPKIKAKRGIKATRVPAAATATATATARVRSLTVTTLMQRWIYLKIYQRNNMKLFRKI